MYPLKSLPLTNLSTMTIFERLSGDFRPRPDYFVQPIIQAGTAKARPLIQTLHRTR